MKSEAYQVDDSIDSVDSQTSLGEMDENVQEVKLPPVD